MMDFLDGLDIDAELDCYYPGQKINGHVLLSCRSKVKIRGITVALKGKSQVSWKVVKNGAVYTVKNSHTLLDENKIVFGTDGDDIEADMKVLNKGLHKIPFDFLVPDKNLPSSFESRLGVVRYFIRCLVDIPYASTPQQIKYITLIGNSHPNHQSDCRVPLTITRQGKELCKICNSGELSFEMRMGRTVFCSGENISMQLEIVNGKSFKIRPVVQFIQTVEYHIDKSSYGVKKDLEHVVWEYSGPYVPRNSTVKLDDLSKVLEIPVVPPSTINTETDLINIKYQLKICLRTAKWRELLTTHIPVNITSYYPADSSPPIELQTAVSEVEGGNYLSPELQSGQVYDGTTENEHTAMYRPVYVTVSQKTNIQTKPMIRMSSKPIIRTSSKPIIQTTSKPSTPASSKITHTDSKSGIIFTSIEDENRITSL